jgi:hypothetical protein
LLWCCVGCFYISGIAFDKAQRGLLRFTGTRFVLAWATVVSAATTTTITTSTFAGFTGLFAAISRGFALWRICTRLIARGLCCQLAIALATTAIAWTTFATVIALTARCALRASLVAIAISLTGIYNCQCLTIAWFAIGIKTFALRTVAAFATTSASTAVAAVFTTVSTAFGASAVSAWLTTTFIALVTARFATLATAFVASTIAVTVAGATAFAFVFRLCGRCCNWFGHRCWF